MKIPIILCYIVFEVLTVQVRCFTLRIVPNQLKLIKQNPTSALTHTPLHNIRNPSATSSSSLHAESKSSSKKNAQKGVYARPSAAIEKGSGFYVPGLEGSRVRILFGILVLVLSYVNTLLGLGDSNVEAAAFSQNLVTFYGVLLLFQGLVEFGKEIGLGLDSGGGSVSGSSEGGGNAVLTGKEKMGSAAANAVSARASAGAKQLDQLIQGELREDDDMVERVRWVAASFVSLTVATNVLLLDSGEGQRGDDNCQVLYSLGGLPNNGVFDDEGVQAALDTVYKSKGGRVAVPDTHPCAALLPQENRRCILLQQIEIEGRQRCIMIGSNQLLAAFTKNDLKWLGSLGDFLR